MLAPGHSEDAASSEESAMCVWEHSSKERQFRIFTDSLSNGANS